MLRILLISCWIGTDLNPYKSEAPWQSFEFGFHVLEVRAHLVIVTMAWLSRGDEDYLSRMPSEPDVETLTYWIQRLELVVRAEDKEVIVIFCNRTGSEDGAVYAGTSAVVGVKDGEVYLYGILGRGSSKVLVVDTDDPPIAQLLLRPEGKTTELDLRVDEAVLHDVAKNGARAKTTEPAVRHSQTLSWRSPRGVLNGISSKERPAPKLTIPEQRQRKATAPLHKTPITESPNVPTPTAPSPTPLSTRPRLGIPGTRPRNEDGNIDTPYTRGGGIAINGHSIGDSASVSTDTLTTADNDIEHANDTNLWLHSQALLETSMNASLHLLPRRPSLRSFSAVPESQLASRFFNPMASGDHRLDRDAFKSSKLSLPRSEHDSSPGPSRISRDSGKAVPMRPATTNVYTPMTPAYAELRGSIRSRRHGQRVSNAQYLDSDGMVDHSELSRQKLQSEMVQRQGRTETPPDGRLMSPKSRNDSRSVRPSGTNFPSMKRDIWLSRGLTPMGADEDMPGNDNLQSRSDMHVRDQGLVKGCTMRIPGTQHYSMSDRHLAVSRVENTIKCHYMPSAQVGPVESQAVLWSEISRIVSEHIGRPDTRGRQRITSLISNRTNHKSHETRANVCAAFTQTKQDNGVVIRSVRDLSMGPLADPDDDIVAEIIFRRPGVSNLTSRSNSRGAVTPDRPASGKASRRNISRPSPNDELPQGKKGPSLWEDGSKPSVGRETENKRISAFWHPSAPLAPRISGDDDQNEATLPDLSSSVHTLNSDKTCPMTPSPHCFEPRTPKAMFPPPDYKFLLSTASDALSNLTAEHTRVSMTKQSVTHLKRSCSSVW